jgi:capsular polysaccharide biosynthesis protein
MEPFPQTVHAVLRRWWLVALVALVAAAVAIVASLLTPTRQQTTSRYLVTPAALPEIGDVVDSADALRDPTLVATYAEIFNSPTLQRQAANSLGVANLDDYEFMTVVLPETNVLQLSVAGPDPEVAMNLANTLGDQVGAYLEQFPTLYRLHLLDAAAAVDESTLARPVRNALVALVLGGVLGTLLALGLHYLALLASSPPPTTTPSPLNSRPTMPLQRLDGHDSRRIRTP